MAVSDPQGSTVINDADLSQTILRRERRGVAGGAPRIRVGATGDETRETKGVGTGIDRRVPRDRTEGRRDPEGAQKLGT